MYKTYWHAGLFSALCKHFPKFRISNRLDAARPRSWPRNCLVFTFILKVKWKLTRLSKIAWTHIHKCHRVCRFVLSILYIYIYIYRFISRPWGTWLIFKKSAIYTGAFLRGTNTAGYDQYILASVYFSRREKKAKFKAGIQNRVRQHGVRSGSQQIFIPSLYVLAHTSSVATSEPPWQIAFPNSYNIFRL